MTMGRIGDGDVHAAYVEFRAKESDKVRSHCLNCFALHPIHLSSCPFDMKKKEGGGEHKKKNIENNNEKTCLLPKFPRKKESTLYQLASAFMHAKPY